MEVTNKTLGKVICKDAGYTESFFGRFRGLMLSKRKDIVLAAKKDSKLDSTIHMMNMLYEIDVIWVNSEMKVVDYRKKVKPFNMFKPSTWKTYAPAEAAKYVIELGTTPLGNINVGDDISFD